MAEHLKYGAGNHLLYGTSHLVYDCEPPSENTCNACDPPIPDTLYVTFTDLGGDFATYNGKHTLTWNAFATYTCWWSDALPSNHHVFLNWESNRWRVAVLTVLGGNCSFDWTGELASYQCNPENATYTATGSCIDSGCSDTDSCENSVNATCVVSLT